MTTPPSGMAASCDEVAAWRAVGRVIWVDGGVKARQSGATARMRDAKYFMVAFIEEGKERARERRRK